MVDEFLYSLWLPGGFFSIYLDTYLKEISDCALYSHKLRSYL